MYLVVQIQYTGKQQKTSIWKGIMAEKVPVLTESKIVRHTFITQVDSSQGSDEVTEAIQPEDLMPKAKTQSKNKTDFLRLGLNVVETVRLQKEKEERGDAMAMRGWECSAEAGNLFMRNDQN
jgi:hypothetical protein